MPVRLIKNEEIIEYLNQIDGIFIETYMKINELGHSHRRVIYKCQNGHQFDISYESLKRKVKKHQKDCKICNENKPKSKERRKVTKEYLIQLINSIGGTFLDTYMEKTNTRHTTRMIEYECKCGDIKIKPRQKIENGINCKTCILIKIINYIQSIGGKFIEQFSDNSRYFIKYRCKNGHIVINERNEIESSCKDCRVLEYSDKIKRLIESKGGIFQETFMDENNIRRVRFKCDAGHHCETTCNKIQLGHGCKYCKNSVYEETCRAIFEFLYKKPFYTKYPEWLINTKTGKRLELDGYEPKLKLAFEYNGSQHYEFNKYFHKNKEKFEYRLFKDKLKENLCKEHGITLISIPSTVSHKDLYSYITDKLNLKNVPKTIDYSKLNIKTANKKLIEQVKLFLEEREYELLTDEQHIHNCETFILVKCKSNHEHEIQIRSLYDEFYCRKCKTYEEFLKFMELSLPNWFCNEIILDHKTEFTIFCKQYLHSWTGNFTNLKGTKRNGCEYCEKIEKIKNKIKSFKPYVPGVIISTSLIKSREELLKIRYEDGKVWEGQIKNFIRRKTRLAIANTNPTSTVT